MIDLHKLKGVRGGQACPATVLSTIGLAPAGQCTCTHSRHTAGGQPPSAVADYTSVSSSTKVSVAGWLLNSAGLSQEGSGSGCTSVAAVSSWQLCMLAPDLWTG